MDRSCKKTWAILSSCDDHFWRLETCCERKSCESVSRATILSILTDPEASKSKLEHWSSLLRNQAGSLCCPNRWKRPGFLFSKYFWLNKVVILRNLYSHGFRPLKSPNISESPERLPALRPGCPENDHLMQPRRMGRTGYKTHQLKGYVSFRIHSMFFVTETSSTQTWPQLRSSCVTPSMDLGKWGEHSNTIM